MDRNYDSDLFVTLHLDGKPFHLFSDGVLRPVLFGGAEGDDGEPSELTVPEDLSALTEDDARELHARLEARYSEQRANATTPAQLAELRQIREAQGRLVERVSAIHAERAEVETGLAELDEPIVLPDAPAPAGDAGAGEEQTGEPAANQALAGGTPAMPSAQAASSRPATATPAAATAGLTPAGVAAARPAQSTAASRPQTQPARPRAAFVAAAGQTEVQQGVEVDYARIGQMADAAKHRLQGQSMGPVKAFIASIPAFEDMSDLGVQPLSANLSLSQNDQLVREAVEAWKIRSGRMEAPVGRTAAICDPLDIIREIPDCSTARDPFGDSLPQRPAGRLGFQFTPAISLSALDGAVTGGWTDAVQALVDPDDNTTWKPCIDIGCPTPDSVRAEAITACVTFDVTTELSSPERVQDVLSKLDALRTRKRTVRLLSIADGLSSLYTFTSTFDYGAFPALIEGAMSTMARAVYAERIDEGDYNVYLPPGLVETLATDLVGRAYQDTEAMAQAQADIVRMVESITGLRVVRLLDAVAGNPFAALNPPGDAADALPALGGSGMVFPVRFIAPEAALYFSTGEERTGLESSPELMRQNKRQWFSEEFVGLAKHGCHPWFRVDMTLCPNGARTGFNTPVACA